MREKNSGTESVRPTKAIRVGNVTLLPIERAVTRSAIVTSSAWIGYHKTPYALVIRDADGIRAIDIHNKPIIIEQLRNQIPNLDDLLEPL